MPEDTSTTLSTSDATLEQQIEAVLFYKAKPIRIAWLLKFFAASEEELGNALVALGERLHGRGVRLIVSEAREVQLVTAPEAAATIEALQKRRPEARYRDRWC